MPANPWLYILLFTVIIMAATIIFCVFYSFLIAVIATRYSDKMTNKYTKKIESLLPRKDCGACGYASCWEYADAVLHTETDEDKCPYAKAGADEKMVAIREEMQNLLEDPTPVKERGPRFWERKF